MSAPFGLLPTLFHYVILNILFRAPTTVETSEGTEGVKWIDFWPMRNGPINRYYYSGNRVDRKQLKDIPSSLPPLRGQSIGFYVPRRAAVLKLFRHGTLRKQFMLLGTQTKPRFFNGQLKPCGRLGKQQFKIKIVFDIMLTNTDVLSEIVKPFDFNASNETNETVSLFDLQYF